MNAPRSRSVAVGLTFTLLLGTLVLVPTHVRAHCDGLDGPVVTAAKRALENKDVAGVLVWVQEKDEAAVRSAFEQTLMVRGLSPQARELADMYFFETLVRLHRAGEGVAYSGLKPAGRDLGPAIPGADRALESGDVEPLVNLLLAAVGDGVRARFAETRAARVHSERSVEAGRAYVEKYVPFLHYVEGIYTSATSGTVGHEGERMSGAREAD